MTESVGSIGEEAAKLLAAAEEWMRGARERVGSAVVDLGTAHQGPECQICPLCQLLALLRSTKPETFEHLVDAYGSLLLALKSAVDAHERSWSRRRSGTPVEHIDIG